MGRRDDAEVRKERIAEIARIIQAAFYEAENWMPKKSSISHIISLFLTGAT